MKNKQINRGLRSERSIPDYVGDYYWANVLCKRIQNFWHKAGYSKVKVWLETDETSGGNKYYSIRSNLSFNCKDLQLK